VKTLPVAFGLGPVSAETGVGGEARGPTSCPKLFNPATVVVVMLVLMRSEGLLFLSPAHGGVVDLRTWDLVWVAKA
jgi:hypothetical protein